MKKISIALFAILLLSASCVTKKPTSNNPAKISSISKADDNTPEIIRLNPGIYKNSSLGFELNLPEQISKKPLDATIEEANLKNYVSMDLYHSETSADIRKDGTYNITFALAFAACSLKHDPCAVGSVMANQANQGGYHYNVKNNTWEKDITYNQKSIISWQELFKILAKTKVKDLPPIKITEDITAYPYKISEFENDDIAYYILDEKRLLLLKLKYYTYYYRPPINVGGPGIYDYEYPASILKEAANEDMVIKDLMKQLVKSLKFI